MNGGSPLATALWEADRHVAALQEALGDWSASPAPDQQALESDRALVRLVDQLLFRFSKLQDTIGERLVPATLAVLAEAFEDWPMRDRLERLARLGYLDVDAWLRWRAVRNRLAHEYPDAPELRFAALVAAIDAARELAAAYSAWRERIPAED